MFLHPQTIESGAGKDDRIVVSVVEFLQTGVDIAPDVENLQIGPGGEDLGLAAHASGSDHCARREILEVCGTRFG